MPLRSLGHAITPLQALGKPIWIGSEGAVSWDNQLQFMKDSVAGAAKYNIPVIIYFDYQSFAAPASTLQGLVMEHLYCVECHNVVNDPGA